MKLFERKNKLSIKNQVVEAEIFYSSDWSADQIIAGFEASPSPKDKLYRIIYDNHPEVLDAALNSNKGEKIKSFDLLRYMLLHSSQLSAEQRTKLVNIFFSHKGLIKENILDYPDVNVPIIHAILSLSGITFTEEQETAIRACAMSEPKYPMNVMVFPNSIIYHILRSPSLRETEKSAIVRSRFSEDEWQAQVSQIENSVVPKLNIKLGELVELESEDLINRIKSTDPGAAKTIINDLRFIKLIRRIRPITNNKEEQPTIS